MPSQFESKSIAETAHKYLLRCLRVEKLEHAETYASAARIGEDMREYYKSLGQIDDLEPIPCLDDAKKK